MLTLVVARAVAAAYRVAEIDFGFVGVAAVAATFVVVVDDDDYDDDDDDAAGPLILRLRAIGCCLKTM